MHFGTLATYFRQGGPMMWPLLFFSLLALTFIIERFIVFSKAKINVNEFLTKIRKALLVKPKRQRKRSRSASKAVVLWLR